MTIEANLASIAKSLETIAAAMSQRPAASTPAYIGEMMKVVGAVKPYQGGETLSSTVTFESASPVPNVQPVPTPVAPAMVAPAMVAPATVPVAVPVAPVQASPSNVVFADHNSFVTFVMDAYKALGPIKGAKIQEVLTAVGVKNINDVKPEMYAQIKAGVEALAV